MINVIAEKTLGHIELTFISLFIGILIAFPLGVYLGRSSGRKAAFILRCMAIIQTIPGLALLAMTIICLAALGSLFSLPATGALPAIFVLTLYALLPILSSTYSGITQVSKNIKNVALAMGMTRRQILLHVEIPLSLPILINGLRIALVSTIGMVTLTSLVGSGGLGDLIIQGLRTMQWKLVFAGTVPAAFLALFFDFLLTKAASYFDFEQ